MNARRFYRSSALKSAVKPALAQPRLPLPIRRSARAARAKVTPNGSFKSARLAAMEWSSGVAEASRLEAARGFMAVAVDHFVTEWAARNTASVRPRALGSEVSLGEIDPGAEALASVIGREAAGLDAVSAAYWLSVTYTGMLPDSMRGQLGIYYTPPPLSERLMEMATEAGVDWRTCTVLDPACGGGAFLAPAARKMVAALKGAKAEKVVQQISARLRGFEVDPFAAWMSQLFLEVTMARLCKEAGKRLPVLVTVCDSLEQQPSQQRFDLVIGNPPYGRVKLGLHLRERYGRSLYGHANLYGLFTDLALRWTKPDGVVAYVTPTSFLAGEYYKALRLLLAQHAPPVAIDIVAARRGVFENVQQETLLATYRCGGPSRRTTVHHLEAGSDGVAHVIHAGRFDLPDNGSDPWLVPRLPEHNRLVERLVQMPSRLADWGYGVSTGPLVWNRHKTQLRLNGEGGALPLVWAESVGPHGRFAFRAEKRNHAPFFKLRAGDDWLKVDQPCVLLQRTTAKEQARRLIAAPLPKAFIAQHGAVVVENHLNMVRPLNGHSYVSPEALAAVLNSAIADQAFRCISGSVAVSAYELEALPLPSPDEMKRVESLLKRGASSAAIERCLKTIYMGDNT